MGEERLLEVESVSKVYDTRKVVDQVSLHVDRGEVIGLLGRNGAGKTTTLKLLIGLAKPDGGRILFRGEAVTASTIHERSRMGMSFLPQERSVFQRLSVEENVLAVLEVCEVPAGDRRARATRMLAEFGLAQVAGGKAATLSGAQTKRLEICRAMITGPSVLMLDEPFAGVDPIERPPLESLIRGLPSRGASVLLTDHNVLDSLPLCDRLYVIDRGRIVKEGSPSEVIAPN